MALIDGTILYTYMPNTVKNNILSVTILLSTLEKGFIDSIITYTAMGLVHLVILEDICGDKTHKQGDQRQ